MSKLITITGVSRGLGEALTLKFIELGFIVTGCATNKNKIQALKKLTGLSENFDIVDVSDPVRMERWGSHILKEFGVPEILINNAAVINHPAKIWEIQQSEFSRLIDINIKGVYNSINTFVPHMVKKKKGLIINISSGWGRYAGRNFAPYCASKFAIEGLTKSLAEELPAGLIAIPLSPGVIDTDMLRKSLGDSTSSTYQDAEQWAEKAVPYILNITAADNGKSLSL